MTTGSIKRVWLIAIILKQYIYFLIIYRYNNSGYARIIKYVG